MMLREQGSIPCICAPTVKACMGAMVLAIWQRDGIRGAKLRAFISAHCKQYRLDAGENAISVRYTEFFQHADNSHDILRSGIVTVKTPVLKDGERYRLALIDAPKDFDAAQKYKDQPIIGLYDQQKQLLVKQSGAKAEQKAWLSTGVFGSSSADLTKTKTAAPANQPAPVYAQTASVSGTDAAARAVAADQQLVQLWQKSSKQERQKFMSWLAEQAN